MRYLCLIYEDEKWWEKATEADMQKGMAEYNAFNESIKKTGNYTAEASAHQPRRGPVRNGKLDDDGVRRDERAARRLLPDHGEDLNDAVRAAFPTPGARNGTVSTADRSRQPWRDRVGSAPNRAALLPIRPSAI
jgi:hypothetical protein